MGSFSPVRDKGILGGFLTIYAVRMRSRAVVHDLHIRPQGPFHTERCGPLEFMNFVYQIDRKAALKDSCFDRGIFLQFVIVETLYDIYPFKFMELIAKMSYKVSTIVIIARIFNLTGRSSRLTR
jgi:hypothetical protein